MSHWAYNYLSHLINQIYKILPMAEEHNPNIYTYISSLIREVLGSSELLSELDYDGTLLRVLSILEYWSFNTEPIVILRKDIFKAISLCKTMQTNLAGDTDG
jgi:hypothetical protein